MSSSNEIDAIDEKIKAAFVLGKKKSLDTLVKILTNIDEKPEEKKFRAIKKSNKTFSTVVAEIPDTMWFLSAAGFVHNDENVVFPEDADINRLREVLGHIKTAIIINENINVPIPMPNNPITPNAASVSSAPSSASPNAGLNAASLNQLLSALSNASNGNPAAAISAASSLSSMPSINSGPQSNLNLPSFSTYFPSNQALFTEWDSQMSIGEDAFLKLKNYDTALSHYEKALKAATQINNADPSNNFAGLLVASAYANMSNCYYQQRRVEQAYDCSQIGKHYLKESFAENGLYCPEIHMHISTVYLAHAKTQFMGLQVSASLIAEIEATIAKAWKHAQLSPPGVKVITEHAVACWTLHFYKQLSSSGMNYQQQFAHWYLVHESVRNGHL